ncbi:MAG: enoyl-CoA hydratase-related protein [Actinomycetota bacterium]|nr:enoyl-CoA hydratase-related protein [Acidimicrobiales bacterium]MDG2906278.1 enoyl-CoA hydratase-related protein [Acidimicrobiales bacterium]MED6329135.1 enoyl-CoA hydratase-related protein [Actinomycetota bacterium]
MIEQPLLRVERRDDGVVLATLDRPKVNALNTDLLLELEALAVACAEDPPGSVVVTGAGRMFAAGAELAEFADPERRPVQADAFRTAFGAIERIPCPTIAAVNGMALGGGAELAWCCDIRILGEGSVFGQPEVFLGIIPGGGATQRLTGLVGRSTAKRLIWGGAQITAAEALRLGLADEVVPDDELLHRALALGAEYAEGPRLAIRAAKRAIDEGVDLPWPTGIDLELDLFLEVFETEDARRGVESFFEHGPGKATFEGR